MYRPVALFVVAIVAIAALGGCRSCQLATTCRDSLVAGQIIDDHVNFYAPSSTSRLAIGLGAAATLAHTDADQDLADWWHHDVRSQATDDISKALKYGGSGYYVASAVVAAVAIGEVFPESEATSAVGEWGYRSGRSLIVGTPALLLLQNATGASRPGESTAESDWAPFADENGVSGHAFMGAVPFLTAAQMADDPAWKAIFYASSTAVAISRINDDAHYTSQALLGWWIAYLAVDAVSTTEKNRSCCDIVPVSFDDVMGIGLEIRR